MSLLGHVALPLRHMRTYGVGCHLFVNWVLSNSLGPRNRIHKLIVPVFSGLFSHQDNDNSP